MDKKYIKYKCYKSVRENCFFENFDVDIRFIFQVLLKYITRTPIYSIFAHFGRKKSTIMKIIAKINSLIPEPDFSMNKLGGANRIVQIDETMLNYKCKSHRGRSPENRTDALCIIEVGSRILRAFA
ncbi:hypothetical protein DMUE_3914, partial [Dictyocoela muelleri]